MSRSIGHYCKFYTKESTSSLEHGWKCRECNAYHPHSQLFCFEGVKTLSAPLWFCGCVYTGRLVSHELTEHECRTCNRTKCSQYCKLDITRHFGFSHVEELNDEMAAFRKHVFVSNRVVKTLVDACIYEIHKLLAV